MSFLRTLFWIVVAVVVALFCFNNWTLVGINLWNGLVLETKLPVLLGAVFLLGLVPPLLLWQAARYRMRRMAPVEPGIVVTPVPSFRADSPPAGPLTVVPPGGA